MAIDTGQQLGHYDAATAIVIGCGPKLAGLRPFGAQAVLTTPDA